ncbi:C-terminal binding protein [Brachybacterium paraconglomeratum]|uniref:C-terminal binding protein n=1 Tax=Brachybacterium paraconglomeratum TaxID=173362 RepID=UPI003FCF8C67
MTNRTVVITECDHDAFDPESAVADERDLELRIEQSTPETLVGNIQDADGILVQYAQITAEVMDGAPSLRAIGRYGVGVDTVDIDAATARGIAVTNVPDYGTEAVSDHAIGLAVSLARGIPLLDRSLRAGTYDVNLAKPLFGFRDRVFGVLGLGRIGTATARKAAGLGYKVIGYDSGTTPGARKDGIETVSFEDLIEQSQVLSVHVPLTDETRGLIGAKELAAMRDDAVIINTARGGIIDTDALVEALRDGDILGAGIDCHDQEPLPATHPIAALDNVVLTPHAAWYTEQSYAELKRRTLEGVADVLAGRRPRNLVNPEVLEHPRFATVAAQS